MHEAFHMNASSKQSWNCSEMSGRVAGAREKDWHEAGGEKAKHFGGEISLSLPGWKRMRGEEGIATI